MHQQELKLNQNFVHRTTIIDSREHTCRTHRRLTPTADFSISRILWNRYQKYCVRLKGY